MTQPPATPGPPPKPASAYGESRSAKLPGPYKNPATAAVIAALSPGSGQLWVGDLRRGIVMFLLSFLCCLGYFWGIIDAYELAKKANRGEFQATDKYVFHAFVTMPVVLVLVLIAFGAFTAWREWRLIHDYFQVLFQIVP